MPKKELPTIEVKKIEPINIDVNVQHSLNEFARADKVESVLKELIDQINNLINELNER